MAVNKLFLASVMTIFPTFKILCTTLVSLSRWSMDHMPYSCLVIKFRLSIRLQSLMVNSNAYLTFSTIIALRKLKKSELSSFCTWMVMGILLKLWPRSAHIILGFPSLSLFYSGTVWNFSRSELLPRGVKKGRKRPLYLNLKKPPRSPSNLNYDIS